VLEIFEWNNITAPCRIIRLGIDTAKFVPPKDKRKAKALVGVEANSFVIGYVGRLGREKDVLTLYRAFLQLSKKVTNSRLLIVGDGIADVKRHMMHNNRVVLAGNQSDVSPYLQAMDVFVLPSLIETTSLATLEAMSTQVPVICTPVGLIKEYIREKKNGLLFPVGNSLILSLKLEWLASDTDTRTNLGKAGRETVLKEYSWQRTVDNVKQALATIARDVQPPEKKE
jgi:glycosyltransferase involved in cell wall biosynthesis